MRITSGIGLVVLSLALAAPALAQTIEFGPGGVRVDPGYAPPPPPERWERRPPPPRFDGISEREAIRIARRQGLEDVDRVRETPRGFIVAGTDRNGDDIRVVISRDGDVVEVR